MRTKFKPINKILSLFLVLMLVVGTIPSPVIAENSPEIIRVLNGTITKKDLYTAFGGNTGKKTDYHYCIKNETGWKRVNYDDRNSTAAAENIQDGKTYTRQKKEYNFFESLVNWKGNTTFNFQTFYQINFKVEGEIPSGGSVKVNHKTYQNKNYEVNKNENLTLNFTSVNGYIIQIKTGTGAWVTVQENNYNHKAECSTSLSVRYVRTPSAETKHLTLNVKQHLLGEYAGIESDYVENETTIHLTVTPYNSSTATENDKWAYVKSVKVNGEELTGTYNGTVFTGIFQVTTDTEIEIEFAKRLVLNTPTLSAQKYNDDPQTNMYSVVVDKTKSISSQASTIKQSILNNIIDKEQTYGYNNTQILLKYVVINSDTYAPIDEKWSYFANDGTDEFPWEEIQLKLPKDGEKYPTVQTNDLTVRILENIQLDNIIVQNSQYDGTPKNGYEIQTSGSENSYTGEYKITYVGRNNTTYNSNIPPVNSGDYTVILTTVFPQKINCQDTVLYGSKSLNFSISKQNQNAPTTVSPVNETVAGKADGKITGVNSSMEYRKEGENSYISIESTELKNLPSGTYYIRYKETENCNASSETTVTLNPGRKLTVTVPNVQTGYTLKADKTELSWQNNVTLTFTKKEGYSLKNFTIKVNETPIDLDSNGKFTVQNVQEDLTITVEGVVDITAPEVTITLGEHTWNKFFNNITFELFFKDTQELTVTADDKGSGIDNDKIYYYLSATALTEEQVKSLSDDKWIKYESNIHINPQEEYIIYVKACDKDGNTSYISSEKGIVVDNIAPVITGIENGKTYCKAQTVTVSDKNKVTVTINNQPATLTEGKFTVFPAESKQKIIVTDAANNTTEITVTVNKEHALSAATCTHKAKCEICGEECGNFNTENHTALKHIEKKAATTEAYGNTEYWYCEECCKYFADKDGKNEIELSNTVIPKLVPLNSNIQSPHTGDSGHLLFWVALLFLSSGMVLKTFFYRKKLKK